MTRQHLICINNHVRSIPRRMAPPLNSWWDTDCIIYSWERHCIPVRPTHLLRFFPLPHIESRTKSFFTRIMVTAPFESILSKSGSSGTADNIINNVHNNPPQAPTSTTRQRRAQQQKNAATGASAAGVRAVASQMIAFYFRAPVKAFFPARVE